MFCWIVAWIQPDISGCQQDFLIVWRTVENILGYIREQFYRFSRDRKPWENFWNCSRKYPKMFKTDSFSLFRQQKIEFKPECLAWSCHYATGCFVAFLGDMYFYIEIRLKYEKIILLSSSRAFSLSTPVENSEATWKIATKCNKFLFFIWNIIEYVERNRLLNSSSQQEMLQYLSQNV